MTDTKAHWKRRALRAEHELESLRMIRKFDHALIFPVESPMYTMRVDWHVHW